MEDLKENKCMWMHAIQGNGGYSRSYSIGNIYYFREHRDLVDHLIVEKGGGVWGWYVGRIYIYRIED